MKDLRKFLYFHTHQLLQCLNLTHFHVYLVERKTEGTMEIKADFEYLTAYLQWDKKVRQLWKEGNKTHIVRCLCHETAHLITGEETDPIGSRKLTRTETFFDERSTEQVGRIIYRLYWRVLREKKLHKVHKFEP